MTGRNQRNIHMNLSTKLAGRDQPISVGFIGVGIFGSQVVHATAATVGMQPVAIADIDTRKAETTFRRIGVPESTVVDAQTLDAVDEALDGGKRVVTDDGSVLVGSDIDVIVDATGNPNVAAEMGFRSLMAGHHFVNVSVEADTVCGRLLAAIADRNGVTYTLASGDQPGQMVALCEWSESAGFEVIAAGKASREGEPYGTPEDSIERHGHIASFGEGLDPDPKIYNTFLDGTKTAVESVAAANALNLTIDTRGMHHPSTALADIPNRFRPIEDGGVLESTGVIDTVTIDSGRMSVFVVTKTESEQLQQYYDQRPNVITSDCGQYQLFPRPYHFAPETTVSIASAAIDGEPTGVPRSHRAEVIAAAKRDLDTGDTIDGGGGYTVYGVAADADRAAADGAVPFELLEGASVTAPIERDGIITWEDVDVDTAQPLYHLRQLQESMW